jgi:hypothetical protein
MSRKNSIVALFALLAIALPASAQLSVNTNVSLTRNFNRQNTYFAVGNDVRLEYHFRDKLSGMVSFGYYSTGKFNNRVTTTALSPGTSPASITYGVNTKLGMQHLTMGARYFFKGNYKTEYGYNLYGYAGYGILFLQAGNTFDSQVDTSRYKAVAPYEGSGKINRLTLDLALGVDFAVGPDVYLYGETRAIISMTDYPSNYVRFNKGYPFPLSLNLGIRVLFGSE